MLVGGLKASFLPNYESGITGVSFISHECQLEANTKYAICLRTEDVRRTWRRLRWHELHSRESCRTSFWNEGIRHNDVHAVVVGRGALCHGRGGKWLYPCKKG